MVTCAKYTIVVLQYRYYSRKNKDEIESINGVEKLYIGDIVFYYNSLIWRKKDGGELISNTLTKAL